MNDDLVTPFVKLSRREMLLGVLGLIGPTVTVWASAALAGPVSVDRFGDQNQTLPRSALPEFAKTARIRELYRFAVEHGRELEYIPCFCGCKGIGHRSNRDCYVKSDNADKTITYTSHAAT